MDKELSSILEEIKEGGLDWIYDGEELTDWTKEGGGVGCVVKRSFGNFNRKEADVYEY